MFAKFLERWKRKGRQNWNRARRMGRKRFAWVWGLIIGVPMLVINRLWVDPADFARPIRLLGELAVFVTCGYIGGRLFWSEMERRCRAASPDSNTKPRRPPYHRH